MKDAEECQVYRERKMDNRRKKRNIKKGGKDREAGEKEKEEEKAKDEEEVLAVSASYSLGIIFCVRSSSSGVCAKDGGTMYTGEAGTETATRGSQKDTDMPTYIHYYMYIHVQCRTPI